MVLLVVVLLVVVDVVVLLVVVVVPRVWRFCSALKLRSAPCPLSASWLLKGPGLLVEMTLGSAKCLVAANVGLGPAPINSTLISTLLVLLIVHLLIVNLYS